MTSTRTRSPPERRPPPAGRAAPTRFELRPRPTSPPTPPRRRRGPCDILPWHRAVAAGRSGLGFRRQSSPIVPATTEMGLPGAEPGIIGGPGADRSFRSVDGSRVSRQARLEAIAGLAALQDLSVLLEGIEDPQVPAAGLPAGAGGSTQAPWARTTRPRSRSRRAWRRSPSSWRSTWPPATPTPSWWSAAERVLGPRNLDTLSAVHGLAVALSFMDEPEPPGPMYERVFNGRRYALGIEDPATISVLHNLGLTHRALGDNAAARATFEQLLDVPASCLRPRERHDAADDDQSGQRAHRHGGIPAACEILAERVDRSRRVLGPTHPDTLDGCSVWPGPCAEPATTPRADRSRSRPWPQPIATLGPDAPETIAAMTQHSRLLLRLGDAKAATPRTATLFDKLTRLNGPEDSPRSTLWRGWPMRWVGAATTSGPTISTSAAGPAPESARRRPPGHALGPRRPGLEPQAARRPEWRCSPL